MRKTTIALSILLTASAAACFSERVSGPGGNGETCTSSGTTSCTVTMEDNSFAPATIRVTAGSTVTWQNDGASPHTSTGDAWDSGTVNPGAEFERAFPSAGSFGYECVFHAGMNGTVVVE